MRGISPPGPFWCGSTTWREVPVATAASEALPPFSRIDMPAAVASQWVEVTTPNVPLISGLVLNIALLFVFASCARRGFRPLRGGTAGRGKPARHEQRDLLARDLP